MRRQGSEPPSEVNLNVIVTPMLDTCFQLLFFFILMFRPHTVEGQMVMSLPDKALEQGAAQLNNPAPNQEPKFDAELTVMAKPNQDGQNDDIVSQLSVVDAQGKETLVGPQRPLNDPRKSERENLRATERENLKGLHNHLKKVRDGLTNQDDIKIQPEGRLKWGGVVKVMDVCDAAGFKNTNYQPPPDQAAPPAQP